ncbi:50S ribosomal protein L11 methyltransferase [Bombilactobacillus thymidiniphilus]|uniref:50S ribosomal protein L11 methyltransferase n=1 Tax=Bombilactobacillus thymidiniphilus TaxID=2923363 RepID=A0ABY4PDC8_9LACO|nr:50S ribosomal protein L11 methyltransferase [Bombilactobacillus thymidiniphilus]UQS83527.1 50S ribosomal protein L11 methyltransferase [Bombilactobacillus thymidiniphilus]
MTEKRWSQLQIITAPQNFEIITNALIIQEINGIENLPQDTGLAIYLPEKSLTAAWFDQLTQLLTEWGLSSNQYNFKVTTDVDMHWGSSWQPYYQVVPITHFMAIVPSWQRDQVKSNYDILINPEESFGTGEHPTTKLCLQALEQIVDRQQKMIDVGTGTGVLAIAGYKLGIPKIYGYDLEESAVQVARANFALNSSNTTAFVVQQNSLLDGIDQKADLIVANMLIKPIKALIPQLATHLIAKGQVIISGILPTQVAQVSALLLKQQIKVQQTTCTADWACLIAQKEV